MAVPYLGNSKNTIEVLQKYDFVFQKKFGQNFLIDSHVLDKIVSAAGITKDDFVLEIGPGIGTMTQYLAASARKVFAVEIDKALIPILEDTLKEFDNVQVINQDILKVDIKKLAEEHNDGKPIKVVANLPYYITTPIIMGLFESQVPIDSITVMVQKEVADRLAEIPGGKNTGAITYTVYYYGEPEKLLEVPKSSFIPEPSVTSEVIKINIRKEPPVKVQNEERFFKLIKVAFLQRRKTLLNSLTNNGISNKEELTQLLSKLNIDEKIRSEKLTIDQFAELSNNLNT